jgi:ubiquinone/menaquinone biosynthesis C-methylase UbiE
MEGGVLSEHDRGERAWQAQRRRLARRLVRHLPRGGTRAVDLGGGRGQITIPLAQLAPSYHFLVVDRFAGPYAKHRQRLRSSAAANGVSRRIASVRSDALAWLRAQPSQCFDAILSSEFLPQLTSTQTREVLVECHRCLRPTGVTAHLFLSPTARNRRQAMFIEAESDPRWTRRPPPEWFSPPPGLVKRQMRAAGLRSLAVERLPSRLAVRGDAARHLLSHLAVKRAFLEAHGAAIDTRGLEVPDWVIVSGTKGGYGAPRRAASTR